jgi:SAM-dependent methyltransferase
MLVRNLKDRFLAIPWVYDKLRPLVAGGIDFESLAAFCQSGPHDRVFDFGCGTGQLLPFLRFSAYLGVDLDVSALHRAERLIAPNVRFAEGDAWDGIYRDLNPNLVLMVGVVHHLSDDDFRSVLQRLTPPGMRPRIVTVDVSYFAGRPLNNILSRMDRGRHVRAPQEYEQLFRRNALRVVRTELIRTRLRYVQYVGYHLYAGTDAG